MFSPFQDYLNRAAHKYGIHKEVEAATVCHIFQKLIPEIFINNESAPTCIEACSYKKGELTITIESPAWGQEVIMRKEEIINKLNSRTGNNVIKNLKLRLKQQEKLFFN